MSDKVATALRALVRERARHRCEYCRIHEEDALLPHEIDHIQARKHHGETREENLAWACFACNGFKGNDIASIEVETGQIVPLFYPRKDTWSRHFRLEGGRILPRTAKGRVTEYVLRFNLPKFIQARQLLVQTGRYPR